MTQIIGFVFPQCHFYSKYTKHTYRPPCLNFAVYVDTVDTMRNYMFPRRLAALYAPAISCVHHT